MVESKFESPPDIELSDFVFDIGMSPIENMFGTAQVTGEVRLYKYDYQDEGTVKEIMHSTPHLKSCRRLIFSPDGKYILTGSRDKSIGIISETQTYRIQKAHEAPISAIACIGDSELVSGDDDGHIKLWDVRVSRKKQNIYTFSEQEDTISELTVNNEKNIVLSVSTDGTLGVYDLRKPLQLEALSDCMEEDLLSIAILKGERKVVAGNGDGVLNIFSWGDFGDCNDRFLAHGGSIDTIAKLDEDTIITAGMDGYIKALNIHPNKIITLWTDHFDQFNNPMPIQRLAISFDKRMLVSVDHDYVIKMHNLEFVLNREKDAQNNIYSDEEEKMEAPARIHEEVKIMGEESREKGKKKAGKKAIKNLQEKNVNKEFFSDLQGRKLNMLLLIQFIICFLFLRVFS